MRSIEHEFDRDTAVEQVGEGRWRGAVSPAYNIGPYPNGGYLLAIAVSALRAALPLPDPLAVSAHYVSPAVASEDVDVVVEPIRLGRSHASAQAVLSQAGAGGEGGRAERLRVLATFADLSRVSGPTLECGVPPALPPLEECIAPQGNGPMPNGLVPAVRDRFDARYDPRTVTWMDGAGPSGGGEIAGYVRFADGREPDTASMVLIADAFPPAVFTLVHGGWVPTLEYTVHVRARPASGWLRVRFSTRHLRDGYLEEDGEVWDSEGVLVCQSRQLARVNQPPGAAAAAGG